MLDVIYVWRFLGREKMEEYTCFLGLERKTLEVQCIRVISIHKSSAGGCQNSVNEKGYKGLQNTS